MKRFLIYPESRVRNIIQSRHLFFILDGIALIILFFLVVNTLFRLQTVRIYGNLPSTALFQVVRPQSMFWLQEAELARQIMQKDISLKSVFVYKSFPSTINIHVNNRIPVAQIVQQGIYYLIDTDGIIFESKTTPYALPFVYVATGQLSVPANLDPQLSAFLFPSIYALQRSGLVVTDVQITSADTILFRLETIHVMVSSSMNYQVFSTTLQMIIRGFRIEGRTPQAIDLRFDKPVVRF